MQASLALAALELALAALEMAIGRQQITPGELIHHSDRGSSLYACAEYVARLEPAGIQPSMSRSGCRWDNAMVESWMRTLKKEEVDGATIATGQSRVP